MSLAEQAGEDAEALLRQLMTIYDVKTLVAELVSVGEQHWSAAILKRVAALGRAAGRLRPQEVAHLATLLPAPPAHHPHYGFRFIDLFAGIGGIRSGFEAIGGQCVFTSEWNKHAVRTYKANWYCDPQLHQFNEDIRDVTLSHKPEISDEAAADPLLAVVLVGIGATTLSMAPTALADVRASLLQYTREDAERIAAAALAADDAASARSAAQAAAENAA